MDAIEVLIGDHNRVRGLFAQLAAAKQAGDAATTAAVAERIVAELEAHTTIEEEIFYPETRALSKEIGETTAEGLEEHHVVHVLLDEIPGAYKDIDEVMANASSLVEIRHTLKQFLNVKGD